MFLKRIYQKSRQNTGSMLYSRDDQPQKSIDRNYFLTLNIIIFFNLVNLEEQSVAFIQRVNSIFRFSSHIRRYSICVDFEILFFYCLSLSSLFSRHDNFRKNNQI